MRSARISLGARSFIRKDIIVALDVDLAARMDASLAAYWGAYALAEGISRVERVGRDGYNYRTSGLLTVSIEYRTGTGSSLPPEPSALFLSSGAAAG